MSDHEQNILEDEVFWKEEVEEVIHVAEAPHILDDGNPMYKSLWFRYDLLIVFFKNFFGVLVCNKKNYGKI